MNAVWSILLLLVSAAFAAHGADRTTNIEEKWQPPIPLNIKVPETVEGVYWSVGSRQGVIYVMFRSHLRHGELNRSDQKSKMAFDWPRIAAWDSGFRVEPSTPQDGGKQPITADTQVWLLKPDGTSIPQQQRHSGGVLRGGYATTMVGFVFPASARTDAVAVVVKINEEMFVGKLTPDKK